MEYVNDLDFIIKILFFTKSKFWHEQNLKKIIFCHQYEAKIFKPAIILKLSLIFTNIFKLL